MLRKRRSVGNMAESRAVEIFEHEQRQGKIWVAYTKKPWVNKVSGEACAMPDDTDTPPDWKWECNWKIEKRAGFTDEEGWEYASKTRKFYGSSSRSPKAEAKWSDKARRRVWCRIMRREAVIKQLEVNKVIPRIQQGLTGIHTARIQLEEILRNAPEQAKINPDLQQLSLTVQKNVNDLIQGLDHMETQCKEEPSQHKHLAVIKKLRNDCVREQAALVTAIGTDIAMHASERDRSSTGGSAAGGRTAAAPKRGSREWGARNSNGKGTDQVESSPAQPSTTGGALDVVSSNKLGNMRGFLSITPQNGNAAPQTLSAQALGDTGSNPFDDRSETSSVASGGEGHLGPERSPWRDHNRPPAFAAGGGMGKASVIEEWDPDDGVFVDRQQHELLIEQRLKPVDEATIMQEIIDERAVEIEKMHKGIVEVNEMFRDLSKFVKGQQFEIDAIFQNSEEAAAKTKEAFEQVVKASKLQKEGNCVIC